MSRPFGKQCTLGAIGGDVYVRVRDPDDPTKIADTNAADFAAFAGVTATNAAISASVDASGYVSGTFPAWFSTTRTYEFDVFLRVGGSPDFAADQLIASGTSRPAATGGVDAETALLLLVARHFGLRDDPSENGDGTKTVRFYYQGSATAAADVTFNALGGITAVTLNPA